MRLGIRIFLLGFVLTLLVAGGIVAYVYVQLMPPKPHTATTTITIPKGSTSRDIAVVLARQGIIRDAFVFRLYLKYKHTGHRFQAGTYVMKPGMTLDMVIAQLEAGQTIAVHTTRFTIPEGYTIRQIIELFVKNGYDRQEITTLLHDRAYWHKQATLRTRHLPLRDTMLHPLEGYIFPETYEFPAEMTAQQVVTQLLAQLDRQLEKLPAQWQNQLTKHGVTFHAMLTIASLIEREVKVEAERDIVAGVIYHRMKKKMPLQLDATVQYLFPSPKARLLYDDLRIKSPYNTYIQGGLPPGPISSPGLSSIRAALYPQTTPYLYYVTKKDGTGSHLFAKTYAQHLRNIAASKTTAKKEVPSP